MYEELFQNPSTVARHRSAPYAEERARYLRHCACQGYSRSTLLQKAADLLWAARKLSIYPELRVNLQQLEAVAQGWEEREHECGQTLNAHWTRKRFIETARPWLRFLGCFCEPVSPLPFANLLEDYVSWMKYERGFAVTTVHCRAEYLRLFLRWYARRERPFAKVAPADIDIFLAEGGGKGWCRRSTRNMANALRGFFRHAAMRGWCDAGIPGTIQGPRVYSCDTLPAGSSWRDIQLLFASMNTDRPLDVRDRPILMLFAVYGFRASEVGGLRMEDFDWERDLLHVSRVKRQQRQVYPLLPAVGNAVARYLKDVRPPCDHREVFMTLLPPFRPLSRRALYSLTRRRLESLDIQTLHRGPHSLRHACATHLVSQGLSLKEIGDHLGHRSTAATRIYAKVGLPDLRKVAAFDLGDVL